eukprot:g16266.t1
MRLLCELASTREVVSRDHLVDTVWEGRVVSEDAITRQLGKLRSALAEAQLAEGAVESIPKAGVRLRLPVAPLQAPSNRRKIWLAAGLVAVLTATGLMVWLSIAPSPPPADIGFRPLTATPGIETHASVAAGQVAYIARVNGFLAVHVMALAGGQPKVVTFGTGHALHPTWSPDATQIAFIHQLKALCEIRLLDVAANVTRTLAPCADGADGGLHWSPDGRQLAVSDRAANGQLIIRLFDMNSGQSTLLHSPPANSYGDKHPRFSPNGEALAFLRVAALGVEDLHVTHLSSGQTRRVSFTHQKMHGFDWTANGDGFYVSSNRLGGVFRLWRLGLDSRWQVPDAIAIAESPTRAAATSETV